MSNRIVEIKRLKPLSRRIKVEVEANAKDSLLVKVDGDTRLQVKGNIHIFLDAWKKTIHHTKVEFEVVTIDGGSNNIVQHIIHQDQIINPSLFVFFRKLNDFHRQLIHEDIYSIRYKDSQEPVVF